MTLPALRTRLETATEADQAEVLEMAYRQLLPMMASGWATVLLEGEKRYRCFRTMIEAKAYESAALLIMREVLPGWGYVLYGPNDDGMMDMALSLPNMAHEKCGRHKATSLAIIAAICAAKGDGDA